MTAAYMVFMIILRVDYSLVCNLNVDAGEEGGKDNLDGEDGHYAAYIGRKNQRHQVGN